MLSGYNAAQLMGADLKKACEGGSLTRQDVVKAHRSQKNADTGLGTPQNFTLVTEPASRSTYVLKPDAKAAGGLVGVEEAHKAPGVDAYLAGRG